MTGPEESRRVIMRHGVDDTFERARRSIEVFVDPACDPPCGGAFHGCIVFPYTRRSAKRFALALSELHGGLPIVDELKGTPRGGGASFAAPWTRGARRGG